MAEATDRPQGAELDTMPGTSSESYRPLSLLALAGFGVAALYALIVLLGGVVSLFNRVPWLMPLWTFLIPFTVLVLCGAARTRIRNSEALGGLAFTAWGFRLTVVVALLYAVYYSVSFFAVSLQAKECAKQFFEQLKQGALSGPFCSPRASPPRTATTPSCATCLRFATTLPRVQTAVHSRSSARVRLSGRSSPADTMRASRRWGCPTGVTSRAATGSC